MPLEIQATYENGSLKLDHPLPLKEKERVTVVVQTARQKLWAKSQPTPWTGDPEVLRLIAEAPELRDPGEL